MALTAVVKVSSITNLSDARYCAGMGVDMLGFDINPESKDYINPLKFQEITGWVAGVKHVGEVHGLSEEAIRSQLVQYELDCLEISDLSLLPALQQANLTFIVKALATQDLNEILETCQQYASVDYVFLELNQPLSERKIEHLAPNASLLLGYEINPQNAQELLALGGVKGFVLKGSQEIKPGFKDYDELADILELLEEDN